MGTGWRRCRTSAIHVPKSTLRVAMLVSSEFIRAVMGSVWIWVEGVDASVTVEGVWAWTCPLRSLTSALKFAMITSVFKSEISWRYEVSFWEERTSTDAGGAEFLVACVLTGGILPVRASA